jgi:sterol desaturase/sphingolipid hydroxylase (fatty acid hydroxylase superfamily)
MAHQWLLLVTSSTMVIVVFCILEMLAGKFAKSSWGDAIIDLVTFSLPDTVVHPFVVFASAAIVSYLLPKHAGAWAGAPWWAQFLAFLVFEDMVNYWFHRSAHKFSWLWRLHLAHHTPTYMSARVIHRNSILYNLMFPNLYFAAILVYLGFGETFVWYSLIKNIVLAGAHSELRWDAVLYRYKFLHPVAWIVERTISTPATHFAHHAENEDDGIGHYHGNYCNLMFLWDVMFGTALITRKYPPRMGVIEERLHGVTPWYVQLFYPLLSSRQPVNQDALVTESAAPMKDE